MTLSTRPGEEGTSRPFSRYPLEPKGHIVLDTMLQPCYHHAMDVLQPCSTSTPDQNRTMKSENTLLSETLTTVNSLYEETNNLTEENRQLKAYCLKLRAVCGIHQSTPKEDIDRKLSVLNSFRVCGFKSSVQTRETGLEWSKREIPFLIEKLTVEELEFLAETMSYLVAEIVSYLKGNPTIKIRREQKIKEDWDRARKEIAENENFSPRAKNEQKRKRKVLSATERAIAMLMKTGISEAKAQEMVANMQIGK